jgi:hypothetical protein
MEQLTVRGARPAHDGKPGWPAESFSKEAHRGRAIDSADN